MPRSRGSISVARIAAEALAWLERYFDVRAKPVQGALEVVKSLGGANVAMEPPTLNETLAALRNFKAPKK